MPFSSISLSLYIYIYIYICKFILHLLHVVGLSHTCIRSIADLKVSTVRCWSSLPTGLYGEQGEED